jgi:DNA helicase-2/ATP-dependent DNA helicase PcrA
MPNDADDEIGRHAAALLRGSVVAAAGCGKTEQIARAVAYSARRRLILTHTHAGVDAITKRLKLRKIPSEKYRVDTIAGWCLRFASAFPKRSGIGVVSPALATDWKGVYEAATTLVTSGAIGGIIEASYGGLFVDEYQDCTREQHDVVRLLAGQIPCCIFGDPLQSIFDFRGQQPVDWDADVFPAFPRTAELTTPWRWKNAENPELAEWLKAMRSSLEQGGPIDFNGRPDCVKFAALPTDPQYQQSAVIAECLRSISDVDDGNLIVIGDGANANGRANLALKLGKYGFSMIEPVGCKELFAAARTIQSATGVARFKAVLGFVAKCMSGTDKAGIEKAVESHLAGGRRGHKKFGDILPIVDAIIKTNSDEAILAFLIALQARDGISLFRREMFFAMRSALQIKITRESNTLPDSIWEVQNRIRHAGRKFSRRSIGSTLLVKGLEFDHAVIVHAANMTRKDWYVALTRATNGIRVIAPQARFVAAA